jgi:hypothetical protein
MQLGTLQTRTNNTAILPERVPLAPELHHETQEKADLTGQVADLQPYQSPPGLSKELRVLRLWDLYLSRKLPEKNTSDSCPSLISHRPASIAH